MLRLFDDAVPELVHGRRVSHTGDGPLRVRHREAGRVGLGRVSINPAGVDKETSAVSLDLISARSGAVVTQPRVAGYAP